MSVIENELLVCECYSLEHQLVFNHIEPEEGSNEPPEVYMHIHLSKLTLWRRIKYAWAYILGRQAPYGAFEEMILGKKHANSFRRIADVLDKQPDDKSTAETGAAEV